MSLSLEEKINKVVPDYNNEVISIQTAFENLIINDKIIKPFLLIYDEQNKKPLVSFTRAWLTDNPADYFASIAEILFIIPAINTKSYILAIHPKTNPFFNANKSYPLIYENSIILFHDIYSYWNTVGQFFSEIDGHKYVRPQSHGLGVFSKNEQMLKSVWDLDMNIVKHLP